MILWRLFFDEKVFDYQKINIFAIPFADAVKTYLGSVT